MHENAPFESVVMLVPLGVPAEHSVAVRSSASNATVTGELTSNPAAVTVNELPTGP